jgi:hypothetical protein
MLSSSQKDLCDKFLDATKTWESTDHILRLASFYLHDQRKVLEGALDVLDGQERIQCFAFQPECGRRRCFWKVPVSTGKSAAYTCVEYGCDCHRYIEMAKSNDVEHEPMCKHLIAVRVGTALGLVDVTFVSDEDFVRKLAENQERSLFYSHSSSSASFSSAHVAGFNPHMQQPRGYYRGNS